MLLKDISFQTADENILYDDVLLRLAEEDRQGEVLRFWESSQYFIVLGRISNEQDDVKMDVADGDSIPILRRSSGGGTVLQGRGCLNYSLILSKKQDPNIADLRKSYEVILSKVIQALGQIGVEAVFYPTSDIALKANHKKISGNAQKRSKKFILHHGTILYNFDLNKIEKYLRIPKDIPEYRQSRSHLDFISNIPSSVDKIKAAIKGVFSVGDEENYLNDIEKRYLNEMIDTKGTASHINQ